MAVFTMPSLGSDMAAGTLIEWLVQPGDSVRRGDVVAVVETQKGAIEIETFQTGTVQELTAEPGQTLPVGAPLAIILAEGETLPETPPAAETVPETPVTPAAVPSPAAPPTGPAGAPAASPAARVRARELGVDLAALTGSGPGGAVVLADVDAAAPGTAPGPARRKTGLDLAEMRKAIAAAMTRSKQTIPHFYLSQTMDLQPATDFLAARNADRDPADRLLMGALFLRATVLAAQQVKGLNGQFDGDTFTPSDQINPGVAVALRGGGLIAPALIDAGAMTLDDTMSGLRDLVTRARSGRLRNSEMTQGTITVSALGETGAEAMAAIIFPPQVAMVGIGAPQTRPWVVGDAVRPRQVVTVTLSADHRVSDGRLAARFLAAFDRLITAPEAL